MKLNPITVECYAGAKADETPRRFVWNEHPIEVEEVLDRWYQVESKPEWPRADYFKVRGVNARAYLLKHDLESDEWYLGQQW
jgi:formylmethanofuran dehydrogenase subunit E